MITIRLHGYMKKLYPDEIRVHAASIREAMGFLKLIPELKPRPGSFHRVRIKGVRTDQDLNDYPKGGVIDVYSHFGGAGGRNGLFQIILGVVIIAAVLIATGGSASLIAGPLIGGITGSQILLVGATMVLGGLVGLFSPQPTIDNGGDNTEASKYLPSTGNTVRIGTRIPIIYGTRKWGGHILSLNVDARAVDPSVGPGGGGSVGGGFFRDWTDGQWNPPALFGGM